MAQDGPRPRFDVDVGVIEGFFGNTWSWDERASYADFLRELGFAFYIYTPKDDRYLRQDWRKPWPEETMAEASALARAYRDAGLSFGLGFSPFELHLDTRPGDNDALQAKVAQLNAVGPDILCIQFDDMRGDAPGLADQQMATIDDICGASTARRFIACPTYYSLDPALERVFGAMPENYLSDFGRLLDPAIDIFWTGPAVCSRDYPANHLVQVAELLRRKPFLWDNYPVNDSASMAPFLHLGPFRDRPAAMLDLIGGHAVNPMNQPWLSRIPIRTLSDSYAQGDGYDPDASFEAACVDLCGDALGRHLVSDLALFQRIGLEKMTSEERDAARERYAAHRDDPYADEVLRWLAGGYPFDPACLT